MILEPALPFQHRCRFTAGMNIQLGKDASDMPRDRARADAELVGNPSSGRMWRTFACSMRIESSGSRTCREPPHQGGQKSPASGGFNDHLGILITAGKSGKMVRMSE